MNVFSDGSWSWNRACHWQSGNANWTWSRCGIRSGSRICPGMCISSPGSGCSRSGILISFSFSFTMIMWQVLFTFKANWIVSKMEFRVTLVATATAWVVYWGRSHMIPFWNRCSQSRTFTTSFKFSVSPPELTCKGQLVYKWGNLDDEWLI